MQCYIEHKNYKQFADVYGDEGVNLVYSQLLDIPFVDEIIEDEELKSFRINKVKKEIYNNLKQIFKNDLKEDDVKFVTSLGSSIATFKANGEILFNELTLQNNGVEYHEAFHKIFRMYMEDTERQELYDEVRKVNPDKPWQKYNRPTEEEQIEELLADDFMKYSIEKNYKDRSAIAKFFFKLFQFLNTLFSRPERLESIYDKILNGGYEGQFSKTPLLADANKFIMDYVNSKEPSVTHQFEMSLNDKDSIVDELIASLVKSLFDGTHDPYRFIEGQEDLKELFNSMLDNFIRVENLTPSLKAVVKYNFFNKKNQIRKAFYERLNEFRIKLTKADEAEIEQTDGDSDRGFDIPAQQFDPTDAIGKVIKLKLSTIIDTRVGKERKSINDNLGTNTFNTYAKFGEVWKSISKVLAYTPAAIDEMLYSLDNSPEIPEYIKDGLVDSLIYYKDNNPRFVTDFVSSFNKSNYQYARALVVDGKVEFKEITFGLAQAKVLKAMNNVINEDSIYRADDKEMGDMSRFFPESNRQKETVKDIVKYVQINRLNSRQVRLALMSVSFGQRLESLDKNLTERDINTLTKLKNYFTNYAKALVTDEGIQETMHLTIKGKPIYDISFDTTLSKTFKILRFIQNAAPVITSLPSYQELQDATKAFKIEVQNNGFDMAINTLNNSKSGYERYILLNYYQEHLVNSYSFKQVGDKVEPNSIMLNKMMSEDMQANLTVMDGIEELLSGSKENSELGELSAAELQVYYITNLYKDIFDTIKHSDRSTFFAVTFKDSNEKISSIFDLDKKAGADSIINKTASILLNNLLTAEKNYYNSTKDSYIKSQNKYFVKGKMRNAFSDMIEDKNVSIIQNYFDTNKITESQEEVLKSNIADWLKKDVSNLKNNLIASGVLNKDSKVNEIYKDFIPSDNELDLVLTYVNNNAILFHMEEQMILYSHFNQYKDSDDLYKRMNTHSGTGRSFDQSITTNIEIAEDFNNTQFTIRDLETGEVETLQNEKYIDDITPTIIQTTFNEFENYKSKDLNRMKSDLQNISLPYLKAMLIAEGMTESEAETSVQDRLDLYTNDKGTGAYDKMNLPDGQSYISIFFVKEYKKRLGEWTDEHEILFKAELEVMSLDTKNLTSFELQKAVMDIMKNAYLDVMEYEESKGNKLSLQETYKKYLHSLEVLKPQYGGPTTLLRDNLKQDDFMKRIYSYAINKTSFFPLIPSVVIGTGLHQLHNIMLKESIDITSMQSATKTGCIDYKEYGKYLKNRLDNDETFNYQQEFGVNTIEQMNVIVSKLISEGLEVYDTDGKFNKFTRHVFKAAKQYLNWTYLKDQVKIHDHPKEAIRNSTQAMKNVLANLYIYKDRISIPVDMLDKGVEAWKAMSEEERLSEETGSQLYRDITNYYNAINSLIESELASMLTKIDYKEDTGVIEDFKKFRDLLVTSAKDRNSPNNVIEALELFADSTPKILETLSNKSKIEPIIYSLLSKIINFKRPGNSVPMVSSQLLEPFDTTKTDRETVSDHLSTYSIENDRLKPAEIIYPLPRHWFNKVIKAVNREYNLRLDNIFDALPYFNQMLKTGEREIIVKGLRIPNQQYSSTDIVKIKEFKLPNLESFVFVYAEIVAKTGGDFDVDKLNMFFYEYDDDFRPILTEEQIDKERIKEQRNEAKKRIASDYGYSEEQITNDNIDLYISEYMSEAIVKADLYNKILDAEINIFRNKANYWQMMMPISDDYLKGDLLKFMKENIKKWESEYKDIKYIKDDKSSYSQVLTPSLNIIKTILYLQGKAAVGIIAPQGTGHSISGRTPMSISPNYITNTVFDIYNDKAKALPEFLVYSSLPLPKEFYNDHLSAISTKDGQIITEVISQLLNSQLDIGKNPYPASMGLLLENINFICYAVRRGVPLELVLQIVQHPEVKKFTQYRAKYESIFAKANKKDPGRNKIIQTYLTEELYNSNPDLGKLIRSYLPRHMGGGIDIYSVSRIDEHINIKVKDKSKSDKFYSLDDSTNKNKADILIGYMQMMEQSRVYGDFMRYATFDTKTFKDKAQYDSWKKLSEKVKETKFFTEDSLQAFDNSSLISVFKKLKDHYSIFDNLYYDTLNKGVITKLASYFRFRNTQERERFQNNLSTSLVTYMVQKEFSELTNIELNSDNINNVINGFIVDIKKYFDSKPQSYFFNSFNIVFNYDMQKNIHAMYTKERVRNTQDINNMLQDLQQVKEDNPDIYAKIVLLPFLTTGLSASRFNFQDTLPQDIRYEVIKQSLYRNLNISEEDQNRFLRAFVIRNRAFAKGGSYESENYITTVYPKKSEHASPTDPAPRAYIFISGKIVGGEDVKIYLDEIDDNKVVANYAQPSNQPKSYALPQAKTELEYKWSRTSSNSYEVSSEGDKRFSALYAKLKDGRTIEEAYQLDIKGYRSKGNDWKLGKGKPPLISMSKEESWQQYKELWRQYLNENPALMQDLREKAKGKVLTDKFANTDVSQARALAEILNESREVDQKQFKLSQDKKNKDQGKANYANAYIGFGIEGTSTYQYMLDAKNQNIPYNDNIDINSNTIAFVSVNGNNRLTESNKNRTVELAKKVIQAGGTVIMDNPFSATTTWNSTGEQVVQKLLGDSSGLTKIGNYTYFGRNPDIDQKQLTENSKKNISDADFVALLITAENMEKFIDNVIDRNKMTYQAFSNEMQRLLNKPATLFDAISVVQYAKQYSDSKNKLNPQHEKFRDLTSALLEFNKVPNIILEPVIGMTQVIKKNDDGTTTLLAVYDKNNQLITSDFLMKDDRRMTLNEIMEDLYTKICK